MASHDAQESQDLWENEVKARSKLGLKVGLRSNSSQKLNIG